VRGPSASFFDRSKNAPSSSALWSHIQIMTFHSLETIAVASLTIRADQHANCDGTRAATQVGTIHARVTESRTFCRSSPVLPCISAGKCLMMIHAERTSDQPPHPLVFVVAQPCAVPNRFERCNLTGKIGWDFCR
jgi:hypothetical protein